MEAVAGMEQRIWFESSRLRGPDGRIAKMHLNCLEILYLNAKQTNKPSFPLPLEKNVPTNFSFCYFKCLYYPV